jgi:hypothetical protein
VIAPPVRKAYTTGMQSPLLMMLFWFLASPVWAEREPDIDVVIAAYQHRDYTSALAGFGELAIAGDSRAQTILALMHRFGEGTPVDLPQAFSWYQRAATAGYAPAQYHLASMLAAGIGTAVDKRAATVWLQSAARAGFNRASKKLAETGLTADSQLSGADPQNADIVSTAYLTGASAEIRDLIEWNLRLPNDWRLNTINRQEDDRIIDHLPQMAHRDYRIQLGIFDSRPRAVAFWQYLVAEYPSLLMNLQPFIESSQYPSQRITSQQAATTHRIQAGTFRSFSAAKAMCSALLSASVESGCLPITVAATGLGERSSSK